MHRVRAVDRQPVFVSEFPPFGGRREYQGTIAPLEPGLSVSWCVTAMVQVGTLAFRPKFDSSRLPCTTIAPQHASPPRPGDLKQPVARVTTTAQRFSSTTIRPPNEIRNRREFTRHSTSETMTCILRAQLRNQPLRRPIIEHSLDVLCRRNLRANALTAHAFLQRLIRLW